MIRQRLLHPARIVALAFLLMIVIGTALLMMPVSRAGDGAAPPLVALFTAVSAVCVTGLVVVDTGTYWSSTGQGIVLVLFQLGGFGMMTAATLLGLMVNRSPRLRLKLITQTETHSLGLGDVANVARLVLAVTISAELIVAAAWRCASTSPTAWPGRRPRGAVCFTPSPPLTTQAFPSMPTASCAMPPMP